MSSVGEAYRLTYAAQVPVRGGIGRFSDPLIVGAISLFVAAGSGSQTWTGFNSPDSEFYATLARHGSDVADRALDPAYTWTRLGYIAPVRVLVTTLDPFAGFWLWRLILITAFVGAIYALVQLASTRSLAIVVSTFAGLNTMVLAFAGNTYLSGTVLALTSVLVALGAWPFLGTPPWRWLPALLAGFVSGWLVMTNPYGLILGMSVWLALRLGVLVVDRSWRALARDAAFGIVGFAASCAVFLTAGALIFPGRNWLSTYLDWNARLDYASFVGDPNTWRHDIGLLVPAVAVVVSVISLWSTRSRASVSALLVSATSVLFTVVYVILVPGPWLEAPTYVALLWPGALAGTALAIAAIAGQRPLGVGGWVAAAALLPLVLWAGRWDTQLTVAVGAVVAAVMCLLTLGLAVVRDRVGAIAFGLLVAVVVGGLAIGSQILQNGRGLLGTYGQYPLRAAFVDFNIESLMRSKMDAQQFVLDHTAPTDRIMTWTDADRLTAGIAAMQLWGWYNTVSTAATLAPGAVEALRAARPDAIAMYAPKREQITAFWASLPRDARASAPRCTSVPFLGIGSPEALVCVTRLTW